MCSAWTGLVLPCLVTAPRMAVASTTDIFRHLRTTGNLRTFHYGALEGAEEAHRVRWRRRRGRGSRRSISSPYNVVLHISPWNSWSLRQNIGNATHNCCTDWLIGTMFSSETGAIKLYTGVPLGCGMIPTRFTEFVRSRPRGLSSPVSAEGLPRYLVM